MQHGTTSMNQSSLMVNTDLKRLTEVVAWFEQFNCLPLTRQLWLEAQLALVEGFTNAVRHAHQNLPATTPIKLDAHITPEFFQLRIWDHGAAFDFEKNLTAIRQITHHPDFEPLSREAHWGSILLLKLTTEQGWLISYDRMDNDRNCLKIEKAITPKS